MEKGRGFSLQLTAGSLGTRSSRKNLNYMYFVDHIVSESKRIKNLQQEAVSTQKHTCVCPLILERCSFFDNGSSNPIPYKPAAQENLKLSLEEQSHSVVCGVQNRRKKWKTKHPDKLQR